MMMLRGLLVFISLILIWQFVVWITQLPPYILPSPMQVLFALINQADLIFLEAIPTFVETWLGLLLAILLGCSVALSMVLLRPLRYWMLPILLISQALPVFAIAPLLVIWLGYGMASKIATTTLMLFFPIASAFYDGLRRTDLNWLDLAQTMDAANWRKLVFIRIPSALPSLATGLRVATAAAPIGAVIGEWVGSSAGLGFFNA